MRPHGSVQISARAPRAQGVCQRCGFSYNLDRLQNQYDYQGGPRLKNLYLRVCPTCLDVPQINGKTVVLPPDPRPVPLALPEDYVGADNPLSYLGYNPADRFLPIPTQTGNIGNMTLNAGVDAAFDANSNKRAQMCAALAVSNSSFQNTVGKNWAAYPSGITATTPSTAVQPTHVISTFTITAPNDRKFLNSATGITGYHLDGSTDGVTWTTLNSGTTAGTVAESITATSTSTTFYQYHRIALQGDGISAVAIAQAIFNVADAAANDI